MSCSCERCADKRQLFCNALKTLSGGVGVTQNKIQKNIATIPEVFISDLRKLLHRLRTSSPKLTPRQRALLQSHRNNLRKFTTTDPRQLLAKKRSVKDSHNARRITLAQAIGEIFNDNPTFLNQYLSDISDH